DPGALPPPHSPVRAGHAGRAVRAHRLDHGLLRGGLAVPRGTLHAGLLSHRERRRRPAAAGELHAVGWEDGGVDLVRAAEPVPLQPAAPGGAGNLAERRAAGLRAGLRGALHGGRAGPGDGALPPPGVRLIAVLRGRVGRAGLVATLAVGSFILLLF